MRKRKHTTPLLSALAASMLFTSFLAAVSAHSIYRNYDTAGWGQPIISVLMEGIAHRGGAGNADRIGDADSASLLANGQTNTGELPDALSGQQGTMVSGSVTSGQRGMDAGVAGGQQGVNSTLSEAEAFGGQQGTNPTASDGSGPSQRTSPGILDGFGDSQGIGSGTSGGQQGTGSGTSGDSQGSGSAAPGQTGANPATPDASGTPQETGSGSSGGHQGSGSAAPGQTGANPTTPDASGGTGGDVPQNPDEPKQYAFTDVTQEYFDDALLIGDSRANGVALYSGWANLTYYTENGMTIYNMFQSKSATVDGRSLSIEEALQAQSFGKIYLEIGINEMGTGTVDSFMEAYGDAVEHLRELQPDAIIYVCGIMYVKQSKSDSDSIFNNPNIQERNDRIAQLADGEHIFYLDINELVADDTGHLNPDYTWDEVHLLGKYDSLWLDYFCSHGIVKEET